MSAFLGARGSGSIYSFIPLMLFYSPFSPVLLYPPLLSSPWLILPLLICVSFHFSISLGWEEALLFRVGIECGSHSAKRHDTSCAAPLIFPRKLRGAKDITTVELVHAHYHVGYFGSESSFGLYNSKMGITISF